MHQPEAMANTMVSAWVETHGESHFCGSLGSDNSHRHDLCAALTVAAALPSDDDIATRLKHLQGDGEGDGPAVTDEHIAEHFANLTGRRPISHPDGAAAADSATAGSVSNSVDELIAMITEQVRIEATHEGGGKANAGGGPVLGVPAAPGTADQLLARCVRSRLTQFIDVITPVHCLTLLVLSEQSLVILAVLALHAVHTNRSL